MILKGFFIGLIASLILTPAVRYLAGRFGFVDKPDKARKTHHRATPLLGGVALLASFVLAVLLMKGSLLGGFLPAKHLIGIALGGLILVVGGALDDKYRLRPALQIISPVLATLVIVASGIGISYVTNPLGGTFRLDQLQIPIFVYGGNPYHLTLPGDLFTFVWLLVVMYTTKLLDGLDGLVSGLGLIGFTVLALLSLTPEVAQPELARLAMMAAGAASGFLIYNARPASIFLGEGGSTLVGFLLGTMAILSGGKIGITLLILAVPLMDVVWTIFRRAVLEKKSIAKADLGHLHFRLISLGLSPTQAVLVFWTFAAAFGGAGLFLRGPEKLAALAALFLLLIVFSFLIRLHAKKHDES